MLRHNAVEKVEGEVKRKPQVHEQFREVCSTRGDYTE